MDTERSPGFEGANAVFTMIERHGACRTTAPAPGSVDSEWIR